MLIPSRNYLVVAARRRVRRHPSPRSLAICRPVHLQGQWTELPEQTTQLIHLDEPSGDLGAPIPRSCSTPESPTVSPSCYEVFLVPVVPHWSRSRPEWPPALLQTRVLSSRTYGALRAGWRSFVSRRQARAGTMAGMRDAEATIVDVHCHKDYISFAEYPCETMLTM
jgi:hypothetical protein